MNTIVPYPGVVEKSLLLLYLHNTRESGMRVTQLLGLSQPFSVAEQNQALSLLGGE